MAGPNQYLQRYNTIRNNLASKISDPNLRAQTLARFDADPRTQALRQAAGLARVSTANGDVQQTARQSLQQRLTNAGANIGNGASNFQSASAGIARGMFGIPEMLAAAGERFLPSAITGNRTNASYSNILQMIRSKDTAAIAAHPAAGLGGEIGGSIVGGGAAGRAVTNLAGRVAATGAPVASTVAKAVQSVGTLNKGQKLVNAAKIAATGAAGGAAQAAGEGGNPLVGAAEGAVAAPVVAGGVKLAGVVTRPFRDFLQMSGASQLLSRLTSATTDQLNAAAAKYRAATGSEPTLFELLPQVDRQKLLNQGVINPQTAEQASSAIKARAANLGPEMADVTTKALQPGRDAIRTQIATDLANARGGQLAPGDDDLIDKAMQSPTDMEALRGQEAKAIMAPHKDTQVVDKLGDLMPTTDVPMPDGSTNRVDLDPEVSNAIRSSAGSIRLRPPGQPITADEIANMIGTLESQARKGGFEGQTAQTAADHLQSVLNTNAPEAGAATQQMRKAFAARSRMLEGMKFGQSGQLRDSVQIGTSGNQARTVRNAFDTPEGQAGLTLGQGNALDTNLGGSPDEALRATIAQSRGSTGRQLAQNLGQPAADKITAAAQAQDQSAQALASASKTAGNPDEAGSGEGLVQALVGLHPGSFATTKAWSVRRLMDMTYIPANRAKTMVDMLFSQDPAMTRKAIDAIGNEPNGSGFIKALAGATGQVAADADVSSKESTPAQPTATVAPEPAPTTATADPYADIATPAPADAKDPYADIASPADSAMPQTSQYQAQLDALRKNENPDLIALSDRVEQQESGGKQSAVSKKGAVGKMQVEPTTGPEAAQAAGVPWDPKAFNTDPAYNKLLGTAYLSKLLVKYGGNVNQALAAYNGGSGNVDKALATSPDNWLASMPPETQDYVARVGS